MTNEDVLKGGAEIFNHIRTDAGLIAHSLQTLYFKDVPAETIGDALKKIQDVITATRPNDCKGEWEAFTTALLLFHALAGALDAIRKLDKTTS